MTILHTLQEKVAAFIYIGVILFAAVKGGPAERWTALVIFLDAVVLQLVMDRKNLSDPGLRLMLVEAGELIALIFVVMRHPRRWLIAATGTEVLCVLLRVVPLLDPRIQARAWITLEIILGYLVLVCLVFGTVQAIRQRAALRRPRPESA